MSLTLRAPGSLSVSRETRLAAGATLAVAVMAVLVGGMLAVMGASTTVLLVVLLVAPLAFVVRTELLVQATLLSLFFSHLLVSFGAPSTLAFAHFPLAIVAFLRLVQEGDRANRSMITWLVVSVVLTMLSAVVTSWQALRPFIAWITLTEPFIFFGLITSMPPEAKQRLRSLAIAVALVQLPLAFSQFAAHSFGDSVQGTLIGQGAGHHIMGAICAASGLALLWPSRQRTPADIMAAVCLMLVGVLSDAKQVYGAMMAAVLLIGVVQVRRVGPSVLIPGLVLLAVIYGSTQFYKPMATVLDQKLGEQLFGNKITQATDTISSMGIGHSMLGLGAGNGLSRTALASVPGYGNVPELLMGDQPAALATAELGSYDAGNVSSAASPFSSWLGIYSDLGLLGLVAYIAMAWVVIRRLQPSSDSHKRNSYILLGFALVLGYIFTWLEEPAFTVFIAILIASGVPSSSEESTAVTVSTSEAA